jgi:hypothetical protein
LQGVLTLEQLTKFEALTERPPPPAREQAQRSVISDAPR